MAFLNFFSLLQRELGRLQSWDVLVSSSTKFWSAALNQFVLQNWWKLILERGSLSGTASLDGNQRKLRCCWKKRGNEKFKNIKPQASLRKNFDKLGKEKRSKAPKKRLEVGITRCKWVYCHKSTRISCYHNHSSQIRLDLWSVAIRQPAKSLFRLKKSTPCWNTKVFMPWMRSDTVDALLASEWTAITSTHQNTGCRHGGNLSLKCAWTAILSYLNHVTTLIMDSHRVMAAFGQATFMETVRLCCRRKYPIRAVRTGQKSVCSKFS